jgi:hypothetical protein
MLMTLKQWREKSQGKNESVKPKPTQNSLKEQLKQKIWAGLRAS